MRTKSTDVAYTISPENFRKNYLLPQKPLLIKHLTAGTPAGRKWTLEYIKAVCGDVMVDVFDTNNPNSATAFTRPDKKMRFEEYLNAITGDKPGSLRIFLFNMFKARPVLRKDFPCPPMFKGILGRLGYLFFGAKGVKVRIHQDMDMSNVMLTQFYGRKRVVLISPEYSELLYKLPLNTHSLIDPDHPDGKYPGLKYIEAYECVLEPGDTLFMPSGYWHYITYLDAGFSVSYRKMAISWPTRLKGFLNVALYMPVDKVLNALLGKRWLAKKEEIAKRRADKAIECIRHHHKKESPDQKIAA